MKLKYDSFAFHNDFPFAIYPYVATEETATESFHWHNFCEVTLVKSGSGIYFANGQEYQMAAGDLIIFNNVEPHGWIRFKADMELLVMVFKPEFVMDDAYMQPFAERGSNFKNKIGHQEEKAAEISQIMQLIYRESRERKEGYRLMIRAAVLHVLALLFRYYQNETGSDKTITEKKQELTRLAQAFEYIDKHYREKLTLEEVASSCYMSPSYFSAYFKQATNKKFTEYVNLLRIEEAKRLLDAGAGTVTEVAIDCGFNNMSHFYKIYNTYYAGSPRQHKADAPCHEDTKE